MKSTKNETTCTDKHCLHHGKISLRGRVFVGEVKKISSDKTIMIEWARNYYLPKYERYEKRKSRLHVHKPSCMDVKLGDKVKVMETRPISKKKHTIVFEVIK